MRAIHRAAIVISLAGLGFSGVRAQDVAETAATNANSATMAHAAQAVKMPSITIPQSAQPMTLATPAGQTTSPHLLLRTGPPADEVNRKDFEDNAGEKAGKLFFRSVPSGAEIFLNDLLVGRTPLLMVVAPGKYRIDMRGPRQESGHSTIGVMPKETQTVVINLNQRYPATVSMH